MNRFDHVYIHGQFVRPHGTEILELIDPVTEQPASRVTLGDDHDARAAIASAKAAYDSYRHSTLDQRAAYLDRLHDAVAARHAELTDVMIAEYGGPRRFSAATAKRAADYFTQARDTMRAFPFVRHIGRATVHMVSLGVVGIITPWNASYGFICNKLAMALASGSTAVIKPSELSAAQTQLLTECLHAAELPPGLFHVVTGRGDVVGAELTRHPDIAKITFTGSTAVGKAIARGAVDTLKRVTLELGGKSPNILLDDADLDAAIPTAIAAAYMNSGQACIAGSRLLVPRALLPTVLDRLRAAVANVVVGDPTRPETEVGPMVSRAQYDRVQRYIHAGVAEGAALVVGGEGRPAGLDRGYFVRPTVFADVTPNMTIARDEIFGPVLSVIAYDTEAEAVAIANDTTYGLHGYVSGGDVVRAQRVADQIIAGRVFVNGLYDEPLAPFGGFKQSGLGREFGSFGLEAYVEAKAVVAPATAA